MDVAMDALHAIKTGPLTGEAKAAAMDKAVANMAAAKRACDAAVLQLVDAELGARGVARKPRQPGGAAGKPSLGDRLADATARWDAAIAWLEKVVSGSLTGVERSSALRKAAARVDAEAAACEALQDEIGRLTEELARGAMDKWTAEREADGQDKAAAP
jgi:hypothetical protein